jgi:hypothetical protein
MSKIAITYDKKEYVLEYSRQSVKTMESQGFVLDELTSKPMTMIPMLFNGAFIKNHKGIKRNLMEEIYDELGDKTGLMEALMGMYADTLATLTDDKAETGNASWALVK